MPEGLYLINFQGENRAFASTEAMIFFLLDKQKEIDIIYMNSALISCDLNKGSVTFNDSVRVTPYIMNTFLFDRNKIVSSITQVISIIAKLQLLENLKKLNDPQLSQMIVKAHFDLKESANKGHKIDQLQKKVDKIFKDICSYSSNRKSPVQEAIFESLNSVGIANINSRNVSEEITRSIENKIASPKIKLGS